MIVADLDAGQASPTSRQRGAEELDLARAGDRFPPMGG